MMGKLRQQILTEAHKSMYSFHPGSTRMYRNLWEVFSWNVMKIDVADIVAKFHNCRRLRWKIINLEV